MTEPDLVQALLSAIASGDDVATEAAGQALAGKRSLLPALRPSSPTPIPTADGGLCERSR